MKRFASDRITVYKRIVHQLNDDIGSKNPQNFDKLYK